MEVARDECMQCSTKITIEAAKEKKKQIIMLPLKSHQFHC